MKVFEFKMSFDYDSGFITQSIHKTKKGAYKAMRELILKQWNEWHDNRIKYGKGDYKGEKNHESIDRMWSIRETIILD